MDDPQATFEPNEIYAVVPQADDTPTRKREHYYDIRDPVFWSIYDVARRYTVLGIDQLFHAYDVVRHLVRNDIPGDIVQCGVLLGGLSYLLGEALVECGDADRRLLLYDTFTGYDEGTVETMGDRAFELPQFEDFLEIAQYNVAKGRLPPARMSWIQGRVQDTLPARLPERIGFLFIGIDDESSVGHILEAAYPRVVEGGVVHIDDYGFTDGARRAADKYLERYPGYFLFRVSQGRSFVKRG